MALLILRIFLGLMIGYSSLSTNLYTTFPKPADIVVKIVRTSENDKSITGELYVNDVFVAHTLELPWKDNTFLVSSIPPGNYGGFLRFDKKGDVGLQYWRVELTGTEPRTVIQIHKGTAPKDIQGCIIVGERVVNSQNRLENSEAAFDNLKSHFPNYSPIEPLTIRVTIEYSKSQTILRMKNVPTEYFIYAGGGLWQRKSRVPSNNVAYKELYRDPKSIVLEGNHKPEPDISINLRWEIPMEGGDARTQVNGGQWRATGVMVREH